MDRPFAGLTVTEKAARSLRAGHPWVYEGEVLTAGDPCPGITEQVEALESVFKADTIAELAEHAGLDAAALEAAVAQYNQYCADGYDPDFNKAPEKMHAIEEGPFYIADIADGYYCTVGGVKIDVDCQVLDTEGNVLEGLFAGGCDAGG